MQQHGHSRELYKSHYRPTDGRDTEVLYLEVVEDVSIALFTVYISMLRDVIKTQLEEIEQMV